MITYKEYEKEVYDWLKTKREKDNNFNFSVRVKGSKGAETDYFIGTKKSNYFATTFWTLPVNYPGSSVDAISLVFDFKNNRPSYFFEFTQTKSPDGEQNKLALDLIYSLKESALKDLGFSYASPEKNKMFSLKTGQRQEKYTFLETMLSDIEKDLEVIIPAVDKAIAAIKKDNPDFVAHRITEDEFHTMQNKLEKRFAKYKSVGSVNKSLDVGAEEPTEEYEDLYTTKIGFRLIFL